MKKIYYIGHYDKLRNGKCVRKISLAATRKIEYIVKIIKDLGYKIELISPTYISTKDYI